MKLDQLRKIIGEEVRAAIKEELQDVMNEAVKIASTPIHTQVKPAIGENLNRPSRQALAQLMGIPPMPKVTNLNFTGKDTLQEMLNMTKQSMTGEDYKSIINADSSMVSKPNFASSQAAIMGMSSDEAIQGGLDISQLSFVKNAKKVLDLANIKSSGQLT